ncbi:hypothetical protein [Halorussus ruber]|uniref:hypothetical protein n=1 Tax=Halorussus ruber TaxID=1126238 RepID=UPI00109266F7|nr:hypothetical protein [Halorussus ruber]
MTISNLFHSDPTRRLEEVQKVNARERAETDVREFYETDSAERVLRRLGETIEIHPGEAARFLYVHATFGSGKTHLLKLVGLVAGDSEFSHLGDRLAEQWPGFGDLRRSIEASHADSLRPVFLNLLDRDASTEPPLPFLIYEAIGREMGYPTDPNWLLEWAWRVDTEYEGVWDALASFEHDGRTFEEVLDERASLRSWLYEALPAMAETTGTDLDSRSGVKASIEAAEAEAEPESFGPGNLVSRVETATEELNAGEARTELLLGLDEVALFVGDSPHRYREFEETMAALQRGPNPVVVTTGQYSLPETREKLVGEPPEDHWTHRQVPLEGADTEIIVRKRWLQKGSAGEDRVESLLASMPDLSLSTHSSVTSADPDPVESYPFREYDLSLLRSVMQELITQGRETATQGRKADRDYVQGRALLVLVRSLFTKFGWADAEEGELVTWDVLFDLLVEETTGVPPWVQEMIDNTLVPTFGGETERAEARGDRRGDVREATWEVRLAKALYLLNQTPAVPSTPENLGRLMVGDASASVEAVVERTREGLESLADEQKVLTETTDEGEEVYTLVSEEQETILSRAQDRAAEISPHQLSARLEARLRENDDLLRSDGSRHEVDVGDERLVPLRYDYSVLEPVDRAPAPEYDALRIRVLADDPETLGEQVEAWQEVNDGREGGERVLVAIEVSEKVLDRIRNVVGMGRVLEAETESHEELEKEYRADERRLEADVNERLESAGVYTVHDYRGERDSALERTVADEADAVFGSARKTLSRPLVEVDDAKAMAKFFRGSGEWPLSAADAAMLGVDTDAAEVTDTGWCRAFVDRYESRKALDVETLLRQTTSATGAYRGTPRESIVALLVTLATSNEAVALKRDTEFVTDPAEIGRQVRTEGRLTALQVRFGVAVIDPKQVRRLAAVVLDERPSGEGPDEWLAELGRWVDENSATVKRTLVGARREFDANLDAFEETIDPALVGEDLSTSDLDSDDDLDGLLAEAETFAAARDLLALGGDGGVVADGTSLWARFTDALDVMTSLYPSAEITAGMRETAEAESIPSAASVEERIRDAEGHRVDVVSAQYRRITGEDATQPSPAEICEALTAWLRENEETVRGLLDAAEAEFEEVALGDLRATFEAVWDGAALTEREVVASAAVRQAERYERARRLLEDAKEPESPEGPDSGGETWADLRRAADRLRRELPNADVTDEVASAVEADEGSDAERPSEARAEELLAEANPVLDRLDRVRERLNELDDGSIVLVEDGGGD